MTIVIKDEGSSCAASQCGTDQRPALGPRKGAAHCSRPLKSSTKLFKAGQPVRRSVSPDVSPAISQAGSQSTACTQQGSLTAADCQPKM
jgi:hypothetical protein